MRTLIAVALTLLVLLSLGACASNGAYDDPIDRPERSSHRH